jgi:hypothetical protein
MAPSHFAPATGLIRRLSFAIIGSPPPIGRNLIDDHLNLAQPLCRVHEVVLRLQQFALGAQQVAPGSAEPGHHTEQDQQAKGNEDNVHGQEQIIGPYGSFIVCIGQFFAIVSHH